MFTGFEPKSPPPDEIFKMIGLFDSGVGGLGVLRHVLELLPNADVAYFADQAQAPYGTKTLEEVRAISVAIASELIELGATTVVVACNTASAASLHELRTAFPKTRFVGMEPAIKPAALETRSGVIGVLATAATFQGELFESVVRRFAGKAEVVTAACPDWVDLVEATILTGEVAEKAVATRLQPLLDRGADTLVLGCTHFPFLGPIMEAFAGPSVRIIDPAPAVARQVARVHQNVGDGELTLMASGDIERFARLAKSLVGIHEPRTVLAFPPHA